MSSSIIPKWMGPLDFHPGLVIIRIVVLHLRFFKTVENTANKQIIKKCLWWLKWNMGLVPFLLSKVSFFWLICVGDLILISQGRKQTCMLTGPSQITRCWSFKGFGWLWMARLRKYWPSNIPVFIDPCGSPAICPSYTCAICHAAGVNWTMLLLR